MLLPPGPFHSFNREERNAVAALFGLLMQADNLERFAGLLDWSPDDLVDSEVAVEWTFRRDLWNHHALLGDQDALRADILDTLQPSNRVELEAASTLAFNEFFAASPRPSKLSIQFPGRWSLRRFDETIIDNDEFVRTCRYKWAHNIKPDLVAMTPSGKVLCIEAKMFSPEGPYPSGPTDVAVFARRGLQSLSQTSVQRYLVEELLGLDGTFAFLALTHVDTAAGRSVTWSEVFGALEWSSTPGWVQDWIRRII